MKSVFLEMEKIKDMNSGLGQFCFHFGQALTQLSPLQVNPYFYTPSPLSNIFGEQYKYISCNKTHRVFKLTKDFDVWHCLHQGSPYLPGKKSTKLIVTIHDLNFLEEKKNAVKQKLKLKRIQHLIEKADAITVISKFTENAVRGNFKIEKPLKVIYNGNALKKFENPSKPEFAPEGKFFFSIGIISTKKNFISLIPLLKHFKDNYLIIAGNNESEYAREIRSIAEAMDVSDRLIVPGTISDESKYWLYKNCEGFLFPSIAEGFGLPVVEAMSLGKPVFLSKSTSLPEIGGKEAFYFNSFKSEDMVSTIENGLKDFNRDSEKSRRSIEWSEQFSWKKAAEAYQELYLNL